MKDYIKEGYIWVVDLDLRKFFDTVNHSKMIQILSDLIKDGRVVSLIHRFLRAPICEDGKVGKKNEIGLSQGGVHSPVCANLILHVFDKELERRKAKAVRYADDCVIFYKSKKAAEHALRWIKKYLKEKLFLQVNEQKTKILRVGSAEVQFLGFSFTSHVSKVKKERYRGYKYFPTVHKKKREKFKEKVKAILDRRAPGGIEGVKSRLKHFIRGWVNYFIGAIPRGWISETDTWIRRRIRQLLWKQWKKAKKRYEEIRTRWKEAPYIGQYAYSSNRYWTMAVTPIIHKALSNDQLAREGWFDISKAIELSRRRALQI